MFEYCVKVLDYSSSSRVWQFLAASRGDSATQVVVRFFALECFVNVLEYSSGGILKRVSASRSDSTVK